MAIVGIESVWSLVEAAHTALHESSSPYSRQWRTSVWLGSRTSFWLRVRLLFRALRPGRPVTP